MPNLRECRLAVSEFFQKKPLEVEVLWRRTLERLRRGAAEAVVQPSDNSATPDELTFLDAYRLLRIDRPENFLYPTSKEVARVEKAFLHCVASTHSPQDNIQDLLQKLNSCPEGQCALQPYQDASAQLASKDQILAYNLLRFQRYCALQKIVVKKVPLKMEPELFQQRLMRLSMLSNLPEFAQQLSLFGDAEIEVSGFVIEPTKLAPALLEWLQGERRNTSADIQKLFAIHLFRLPEILRNMMR